MGSRFSQRWRSPALGHVRNAGAGSQTDLSSHIQFDPTEIECLQLAEREAEENFRTLVRRIKSKSFATLTLSYNSDFLERLALAMSAYLDCYFLIQLVQKANQPFLAKPTEFGAHNR